GLEGDEVWGGGAAHEGWGGRGRRGGRRLRGTGGGCAGLRAGRGRLRSRLHALPVIAPACAGDSAHAWWLATIVSDARGWASRVRQSQNLDRRGRRPRHLRDVPVMDLLARPVPHAVAAGASGK